MMLSVLLAVLKLGTPFGDGMVLQRDRPVPVWGWDEPGASVTVSFAGASRTATADTNGYWRIDLSPMPASAESRDLVVAEVKGKSETGSCARASSLTQTIKQSNNLTIVLSDILVGEVWFASGQSNMECPLWWKNPRFRDAEGSMIMQMIDRPQIRFCKGAVWRASDTPKRLADSYKTNWLKFNYHNLIEVNGSFSAVASYFALDLHLALGIPIGVVGCYWGGTPIEPWIPDAGWTPADAELRAFSEGRNEQFRRPGRAWNEMVESWCPMAMRGFLWYQGCANASRYKTYRQLMHALYRGWSTRFENKDLRINFVQLAPYCKEPWGFKDIAYMQEEQAAYEREEPNATMVVINDVGCLTDIHPNDKRTVAHRLALQALRRDYGWKVKSESPTLREWTVEGTNVVMRFDHAEQLYLHNPDRGLQNGFELAGTNGIWKACSIRNFVWRNAEKTASEGAIEAGDTIVIMSPEVPKPKKLRYLHADPWYGGIHNEVGLPLGAFLVEKGDGER